MNWCDFGSGIGWGSGVIHMIFWIFIISLVCIGISRLFSQQTKHKDATDSIEILKRRLASGEITFEDYEKLKKVM